MLKLYNRYGNKMDVLYEFENHEESTVFLILHGLVFFCYIIINATEKYE